MEMVARAGRSQLRVSAEGGAKIPKTTPWRGGASLFGIPGEDAEHEARFKVKFKEWHAHWQEGLKV